MCNYFITTLLLCRVSLHGRLISISEFGREEISGEGVGFGPCFERWSMGWIARACA
jgi:hypothetical protein